MTRIVSSVFAATLLTLSLGTSAAQAQTRVFVAAQGSDSNPCSFAQPCRTFQHAHDTVAAGGEIDVLDPAGYGAVTINKSISIQGHGYSGITVTSGTAITIGASTSDSITLNGLIIDGAGTGTFGVIGNSFKSLVIENCVVRNLQSTGLIFPVGSLTQQTLSVSNSYFTDNGVAAVTIEPGGSGVFSAAFDGVAFYNTHNGLKVDGSGSTAAMDVVVMNSIAANNSSGTGFQAISAAAHSVVNLLLLRSTAIANTFGVTSSGQNATVRLAQSAITGNATGYNGVNQGVILTYLDNYIDANGTNVGTVAPASKQ
jgi:hypothetical protein